jgi:ADP-heptose:LPS heptosyltransferase
MNLPVKLSQKQKLDKRLGNILVAINLVLAKSLGFILRRDHSLKQPPKNILFIKIMGIGSVLMAADAIAAIKEKYPQSKLILLGNGSVIEGIKPTGLFDEYWMLDDRSFIKVIGSSVKNLFRSWSKKEKWVCNLEVYSKLTTIFSLWTGARNRFDFFFNEVSFRKNINTHPVYFNQFSLAHDNYNRMAEAVSAPVKRPFFFPGYDPLQRITTGKKYIIINNTCSELARERLYPDDHLIILCHELYSIYHLPILLSGSSSDRKYYDELIKKDSVNIPIENVAGNYSIDDLVNILYNACRLLITVDSAPLHYAYRLGVPTVSIWGPTNPATRMKETKIFKAVYQHVHCSPCTHHTTVLPCGGNNFCMKDILPAVVMEKVAEVMNNLA